MIRFVPSLALLTYAGIALGCATTTTSATSTASTTAAISDVKSLNGTWIGFQTGRSSGARQPLTIVISDGTYTARFGPASTSTGTVTVTDGKITIIRTGGSGATGSTLSATSTAVIEQRNGRRVLVGQGRNDLGPFSYELTEQK
jgi:hypothetical protein